MNIDDIKQLQSDGLMKQELLSIIKANVTDYNSKCEEFGARFSLFLSNIALQDVQNFLQNAGLKYSKPTNHRFYIDGTGIEIITVDEGFTVTAKEKDVYKTFIVELVGDSQPEGFIYQHIKIKGKLVSTNIGDSLAKTLEELSVPELEEVSATLKNALNDVESALKKLLSTKDENLNYIYAEYKNEDNKYNTIDEIIKNEL
ncbi:hypothetical protein ACE3NQ_21135 [Paenibacillus terreus]|uniref:Phage protein n=1 Tax=Paenibacillus terreus TaxID=1387834 RepID=A0ABV5BCY7_9BACL